MISKEAITVVFTEQYPDPGGWLGVIVPSCSEPGRSHALSPCLLGSRTKDPVFLSMRDDQICGNNSHICPCESKRCDGVQCLCLGSDVLEVLVLQPAVVVHSSLMGLSPDLLGGLGFT